MAITVISRAMPRYPLWAENFTCTSAPGFTAASEMGVLPLMICVSLSTPKCTGTELMLSRRLTSPCAVSTSVIWPLALVGGGTAPPDASGQISEVDTAHGEVSLRDNINSVPVHFGVDKETQIINGNTPISLAAVKPGALVHVKFSAQSGYRGIAREITVIAMPGAAFTFVGKVAYLDVHRGLLAVKNIDGKTYDIHFSPRNTAEAGNLS